MSHYYLNDDNLEHKEIRFAYTFRGVDINFISDLGVFSKNRVDYGTNILLNSLDDFNEERVLDIGCGVGVIGLAIAKRYPSTKVDLVDINKRAISLTNTNALTNQISNANIYLSNLYENVTGRFDYIISNPPIRAGKAVIYKIVSDGINYLNNGGKLIIVIHKKHGALSMEKQMNTVFGNCRVVNKKNGFYVFESSKQT